MIDAPVLKDLHATSKKSKRNFLILIITLLRVERRPPLLLCVQLFEKGTDETIVYYYNLY